MKEDIFLLTMILSSVYYRLFSSYLLNKIKEFKTPEGVEITGVWRGADYIIKYAFNKVKRQNKDIGTNPDFIYEEDNYLRIEVETKTSLRYQKLEWLEEQIKDLVREYDDSVGIYCGYLISDKEFKMFNALKIYMNSKTTFLEDDQTDDFTELQKLSPVFNHYFYLIDEIPLEDVFPDFTAKILLLFG